MSIQDQLETYDTPMMQQYLKLKQQYPDCLLFYRLGDFYELFLEDAELGSRLLDITLTSRDRGKDGRVPMAGVPYHAADAYITKLTKAGYQVAIAEQMEAADGKQLVERQVVRIITPATNLLESQHDNQQLVAITHADGELGIAVAHITNGILYTAYETAADVEVLLDKHLAPVESAEIIVPSELYNQANFIKVLKRYSDTLYDFKHAPAYLDQAREYLLNHFHIKSLEIYDLETKPAAQQAAAVLLGYLEYTQRQPAQHIRRIEPLATQQPTVLNATAVTNLELFASLRTGSQRDTLFSTLDQTVTRGGKRLLTSWVRYPLTDLSEIEARLDTISFWHSHPELSQAARQLLGTTSDIEKIVSRLVFSMATLKDIDRLRATLAGYLELYQQLQKSATQVPPFLSDEPRNIAQAEILLDDLQRYLIEQPPTDPKGGGFIKSGINSELDELNSIISNNEAWMEEFLATAKEASGISTMKIGYNKVFGFYLEVSRAQSDQVPDWFERKQTLVNAERFITPELKEHEETLLLAEEKRAHLEYEIFQNLCHQIIDQTTLLQKIAHWLAACDVSQSLAQVAADEGYTRPTFNTQGQFHIRQGRHPVIEQTMPRGTFVPNDLDFEPDKTQLMIITGPNMAGKSVLMRQVAVMALMAQMGSYVPAAEANLSIVDRIFVRSGASDMITKGLSTFMVEMVETATILEQATDQSLVIMDEIGRGTSTYDGLSLAWSIAEYLVTTSGKQAKTLFATHYHELQDLAVEHARIENYQMAIEQHNGEPVFLYTLKQGAAPESFGISVAKQAGLPKQIIAAAQDRLASYHHGTATKDPHESTD